MSVYIRGMELPTDGNETIIRIQPDGTVLDQYGHHLAITAVPVPPHGRLIDKDAVTLEGGPYEYDELCKWALERYQDAPIIIPADEVV